MLAIIVTGHGEFARGILQSAEMIFGKAQKVMAVTLGANESVEDLVNHYRAAIQSMQPVWSCYFWLIYGVVRPLMPHNGL